jgi:hypothetical protein
VPTGDPGSDNSEMLISKRNYMSDVGDESIVCPATVTGESIFLIIQNLCEVFSLNPEFQLQMIEKMLFLQKTRYSPI